MVCPHMQPETKTSVYDLGWKPVNNTTHVTGVRGKPTSQVAGCQIGIHNLCFRGSTEVRERNLHPFEYSKDHSTVLRWNPMALRLLLGS
jgi:hypothetical protein